MAPAADVPPGAEGGGQGTSPERATMRTWTDASGRFRTEAALLEIVGKEVRLQKTDGTVIAVPREKLSDVDQRFLDERSPMNTKAESEEISLGLKAAEIGQEAKTAMAKAGLPVPPIAEGMLVFEVNSRSSAGLAGIKSYDIILSIGGKVMNDVDSMKKWFEEAKIGDRYPVELLRMGHASTTAGKRSWIPQTVQLVMLSKETTKDPGRWMSARAAARSADKEEEMDPQRCPLELVRASIEHNVLNEPRIVLSVKNNSDQNVMAYRADVYCFDRFDDPVRGLGLGRDDNCQRIISQTTIPRKKELTRAEAAKAQRLQRVRGQPSPTAAEETSRWDLHFRENTAKVKIVLTEVKMEDGSVWSPKEGEEVAVWGESK